MKELELLRPVDLEGWELLERHSNTAVGGIYGSGVHSASRIHAVRAVGMDSLDGVWDRTKGVKNSSEIFKSCTSLPH